MRIIKYPGPEKEEFITCPRCQAELAYDYNDCHWSDGISGYIKFIVCPCCKCEIEIAYIPRPKQIKKQEFYY